MAFLWKGNVYECYERVRKKITIECLWNRESKDKGYVCCALQQITGLDLSPVWDYFLEEVVFAPFDLPFHLFDLSPQLGVFLFITTDLFVHLFLFVSFSGSGLFGGLVILFARITLSRGLPLPGGGCGRSRIQMIIDYSRLKELRIGFCFDQTIDSCVWSDWIDIWDQIWGTARRWGVRQGWRRGRPRVMCSHRWIWLLCGMGWTRIYGWGEGVHWWLTAQCLD